MSESEYTVTDGYRVNLRTGIRDPEPLLPLTSPEQAQRVATHNLQARDAPPGHVHTGEPVPTPLRGLSQGPAPILPPGVAPLETASLQRSADGAVETIRESIANGLLSDAEIQSILRAVPRDTMRRLVYEYAGMGSALLMTLNKQVALVDNVLSQIVTPEGRLRPAPEGMAIDLKDAMNLSVKCTQMILRDLPKVYNVERVQRLEMAIGEVMEKYLTPEQQAEVLRRLEELTTDKST